MVPSTAPPAPAAPQGFNHFMARLTGSGRAAVERHLAGCEKDLEPDHARVWKRLVVLLGRLTPDAVPVPAARGVRFYVPDGPTAAQVHAAEGMCMIAAAARPVRAAAAAAARTSFAGPQSA